MKREKCEIKLSSIYRERATNESKSKSKSKKNETNKKHKKLLIQKMYASSK